MALSLLDFQGRVAAPADWIIPNFLTRHNTGFVMGPPKKACKSWLLLAAAWDLAEGTAVWGIERLKPVRPMRTVYFTQEDSEDNIDARVKAHLGAGRRPSDGVWVVPKNLNLKLDTAEGRRRIQEEIDTVREAAGAVDLVMFDPMRRIHNGNENDSETIAEMWDVIDRIHNRYDCATLISHHTVKPPRGDQREGYDPTDPYTGRGSGDIYGGGDAFVVVVPGAMAGDRMSRRVGAYFESKREQQMAPAMLNVEFGTGRVKHLGKGEESTAISSNIATCI
jgi:RecA-family ATPase